MLTGSGISFTWYKLSSIITQSCCFSFSDVYISKRHYKKYYRRTPGFSRENFPKMPVTFSHFILLEKNLLRQCPTEVLFFVKNPFLENSSLFWKFILQSLSFIYLLIYLLLLIYSKAINFWRTTHVSWKTEPHLPKNIFTQVASENALDKSYLFELWTTSFVVILSCHKFIS